MARKQPPQQPPPVQRLLIQYGKTGRLRFASHRDFARSFERGLVRAEVPMAYSSGFHPHPRISYVNPAPTGVESRAEYVVIALANICDPGEVRDRLSEVMPEGFPIIDVRDHDPDQVWEASLWEVTCLPATVESATVTPNPVTLREVAGSTQSFLAQSEVMVSREVKSGTRTFDARAAVESLEVRDEKLLMVIRHTEPLVRPSDVVGALDVSAQSARYCRIAQGSVTDLRSTLSLSFHGALRVALAGSAAQAPRLGRNPDTRLPTVVESVSEH
ncbi:MAG: TIGR03936 family radical SAM-associated protein [Propionibacteriaceae bacterium]|nr:TIGR03936 family radical SAM-associated protein [Propionibacteriaceae bacterium]